MKKPIQTVKIAIIIVLCIAFAGCNILALIIYSQSFGRVEEFPHGKFTTYFTWDEIDQARYSREEIYFNSGRNKLQGFVYGGSNSRGIVVISQGLGGTADDYFPMIMYFVDRGWRVFAFNNTGVSGSGGKCVRGLFQSLVDLDAALSYIENNGAFNGLPLMLAGHSWGGYAVCAVLNYNHQVNAVVSFAGYNSGSDVLKETGISQAGNAFYILSPQFYAIEKILFGKAAKLTAVDGINKAGIPVMIVQCSNDHLIRSGTTSIYAHREKITNPNAEILFRDGENATGHEYAFCSKEQWDYWNRMVTDWNIHKAEHPNAVKSQWAKEINFDKALANELDPELMERIEKFFSDAR